jgi:hypothetical protein
MEARASEAFAEANEPEREREEQDGEAEVGEIHGTQPKTPTLKSC